MRYTTATKQTLAILLAVVMATSVLAMGFIGGAAADVQEFQDVEVDDDTLVAGPGSDQVQHTITLNAVENDDDGESITIDPSNLADPSVIQSAEVTSSGEHSIDEAGTGFDVGDSNVPSVGDTNDLITVVLEDDSGATDDIEITVTYDLTSDTNADQEDVNYAVAVEDGGDASDRTVENLFSITPYQPNFDDGDAAVVEGGGEDGSLIDVDFGENVDLADHVTSTDQQVTDAFTVEDENDEEIDVLEVDPAAAGDSEVRLSLGEYITSEVNTNDLSVAYAGAADNEAELADGADDVIVHDDESLGVVPALASDDDAVEGTATPTIVSAVVDDETPGEIDITFSEEVEIDDTNDDVDDLITLDGTGVDIDDNANTIDADSITLDLTADVLPRDDRTLTYSSGTDQIQSTVGGVELDETPGADGVDIEVAPDLEDAESVETNDDGDEITVTFASSEGDRINLDLDEQNIGDAIDVINADVSTAEIEGGALANNDQELNLDVSPNLLAADGGDVEIDYTGSVELQSAAGVNALDSDAAVTNDVVPTYESAAIPEDDNTQLEVTFTEDVQIDVGDGNIDVAVTDAFTLDDPNDGEFRVQNLDQAATDATDDDTVVVNLGTEEGDPVEVPSTTDMSGTLDYTADDPTGDNEDPFIAASGTETAVGDFNDEDVDNDAGPTATLSERGQYLNITFTEDIERDDTESAVAGEFEITGTDSDQFEIDATEAFHSIQDDDTVVLNHGDDHTEEGALVDGTVHSDTEITVDYTPSGALVTADEGEQPDAFDPDVQITNNIQPFLTSATVDAGVDDELDATYSEDITTTGDVSDEFSFSASDIEVESVSEEASDTLRLGTDASNIDDGTTLGDLEYDGTATGEQVESDEGSSDAAAIEGDSIIVGDTADVAPVLLSATVDDVAANNEEVDGEIVLTFDRAVEQYDSTSGLGEKVHGINIDDDAATDVNIEITESETVADVGDNQVAVEFASATESLPSSVNHGDSLDDVTVTIDNPENVDIRADQGNVDVISGDETEDVTNTIAGDEVADVESIELDVDMVTTADSIDSDQAGLDEIEENVGVDITGPVTDEDGNTIIDDTGVNDIEITNEEGEQIDSLSVDFNGVSDRFDVTDVDTGSDVTRTELSGHESEEITAQLDAVESDSAVVVHEAFEYSGDSTQFLVSQPMTGEFVEGQGVNGVNIYNASSGASQAIDAEETTANQQVSNGLIIDEDPEFEGDNPAFGYVYDEDIGAGDDIGTQELSEGWNIVSSNFNIETQNDLTVEDDLGFTSAPFAGDDEVEIRTLTEERDRIDGPASSGESIDEYEVYYINIGESNDRGLEAFSFAGDGSGDS